MEGFGGGVDGEVHLWLHTHLLPLSLVFGVFEVVKLEFFSVAWFVRLIDLLQLLGNLLKQVPPAMIID